MNEKSLCPRLIDFIALIGRRANSRLKSNKNQEVTHSDSRNQLLKKQALINGVGVANPELLRRYPSENHKDFQLPTDVTFFCQPEGCVTIGNHQKWLTFRDSTIFVFTLTEKDSAKIRYGISLNFFLNYEHRSSGITNNVKNIEKDLSNLNKNVIDNTSLSRDVLLKKKPSLSSLTSLCLISHHPFVSTFRNLIVLLKQLIDSCNNRCNKNETLPKDIVWSVLLGHWNKDNIPPLVMIEIKQIETWILMLLSSPVPVPGKTKVILEVLPTTIMPMLTFALPDHTRFSLVDFPLHLPIEILGVDIVTQLLAAIMLEHKVVLQSKNYNAVSICVLALVSLLYPLEYMFPIIPLLPVFMPSAEQLLLAPTPFIIGVPASFFAVKNIAVPSDIILVDLDTNKLTISSEIANFPRFPEPELTNLKNAFSKALNKLDSENFNGKNLSSNNLNNLEKFTSNQNRTLSADGDSKYSENNIQETCSQISKKNATEANWTVDSDEIDIAVRVAIVQFYNSPNIFANFSEHARTLRLYPRPVVALQVESFLRSRPYQSEFIIELCKTQSVEYFAESSLCPQNETYVRIHTGITNSAQIGDKEKWFSDQLMPIHFNVYPNNATLAEALLEMRAEKTNTFSFESEDENTSDLDSNYSGGLDDSINSDSSSINVKSTTNIVLERYKPLSEATNVYNAPNYLKFPKRDSENSLNSSISSGRSSPESSFSTSAIDSEADFIRLAQNLALKSNSNGDFQFAYSDDNLDSISNQTTQDNILTKKRRNSIASPKSVSLKTFKNLKQALTDSSSINLNDNKKVPQFMDALNGYAEKSQGVLNQVLRKTAPKAQALRDKTMRPLAEAAVNKMEHSQHLMNRKSTQSDKNSVTTAHQQQKNQQLIVEICEQVIAGQNIGVFTFPKIKRLLEDENLRELACSKLHLGFNGHYSQDDFVQEVHLSKNQYKGYLKILQACVLGLEHSFNTPGSNGLASMFHVFEIAHTHFRLNSDNLGSEINSLVATPLGSSQNLNLLSNPRASQKNSLRKLSNAMEKDFLNLNNLSSLNINPSQENPPPLPQRPPPPLPARGNIDENDLQNIPNLPKRPSSLVLNSSITMDSNEKANLELRKKQLEEFVNKSLQNKTNSSQQNSKFENSEKSESLIYQPSKKKSLVLETSNQLLQLPKHYLYHDLLIVCNKLELWNNLVFWENAFFDMVAQEREIIGMDQEASELIDRYCGLSDPEKKRLELDEDRILAILLHNLTIYMFTCKTPVKLIQQKIRRLLGKAHIGLIYSKKINQLLDDIQTWQENQISLRTLGSRLMQKQSFTVNNESVNGTSYFLEICENAIILKDMNGAIAERWWYEKLVNMTYSPKTRMLCFWRRQNNQVHMHKLYTKKCRLLYSCMKSAMERAAARGQVNVTSHDLGGEFPIHDIEHNQGGLLQVRIDGISLLFANQQEFVELSNIKKCNTFGGNIFVLEELDRSKNQLIQRRYISPMAQGIAWTIHRMFSVKIALNDCEKKTSYDENNVSIRRTGHLSESRVVLPLAVPNFSQSNSRMSPIDEVDALKKFSDEQEINNSLLVNKIINCDV